MKTIFEQAIDSMIKNFELELGNRLRESLFINDIIFYSESEFKDILTKRVRNIQYSMKSSENNFYLDGKVYLFSCNTETLTFYKLKQQ